MYVYKVIFQKEMIVMTTPVTYKYVKIADQVIANNMEHAIQLIKEKHGKKIHMLKIEDYYNA